MKKITLQSFSDPGHGWVKCKMSLLRDLGIDRDITSFSYRRGDDAYLEEDCDAPRLIQALQSKGVTVNFKHTTARSKSSKIRSYFSYTYL